MVSNKILSILLSRSRLLVTKLPTMTASNIHMHTHNYDISQSCKQIHAHIADWNYYTNLCCSDSSLPPVVPVSTRPDTRHDPGKDFGLAKSPLMLVVLFWQISNSIDGTPSWVRKMKEITRFLLSQTLQLFFLFNLHW